MESLRVRGHVAEKYSGKLLSSNFAYLLLAWKYLYNFHKICEWERIKCPVPGLFGALYANLEKVEYFTFFLTPETSASSRIPGLATVCLFCMSFYQRPASKVRINGKI